MILLTTSDVIKRESIKRPIINTIQHTLKIKNKIQYLMGSSTGQV